MINQYRALDPNGEYFGHHGILKQRWGVRNGPPYPLGSGKGSARTAAQTLANGAKRGASAVAKYGGKAVNSFNSIKAKKQAEVDSKNEYAKQAKAHRKQMKKGYHELTDDDLDKRIARLTKEQRYKQLIESVYPDPQKKPGMLNSMGNELGKTLLKSVNDSLGKSINKAIDKMINGEEEGPGKWWDDAAVLAMSPSQQKKALQIRKDWGTGMKGAEDARNVVAKELNKKIAESTKHVKSFSETWDEMTGSSGSQYNYDSWLANDNSYVAGMTNGAMSGDNFDYYYSNWTY